MEFVNTDNLRQSDIFVLHCFAINSFIKESFTVSLKVIGICLELLEAAFFIVDSIEYFHL